MKVRACAAVERNATGYRVGILDDAKANANPERDPVVAFFQYHRGLRG
jgi:hypothetical protein